MDTFRTNDARSLIDAIDSLHDVNHLMEACHMAGQSLQSLERGAICTVLDVAHDKLENVIGSLQAILSRVAERDPGGGLMDTFITENPVTLGEAHGAGADFYRAKTGKQPISAEKVSPQLRWNRANPEAMRAHRMVKKAVDSGELIPEPCEICGAPAEAHHPDYSKPLEVVWLCRYHHRRLHTKGEGDLFARAEQ